MRKVLLKKVPREVNRKQQTEVMAIWGQNTYSNKEPKRVVKIVEASELTKK